jgi:hypothetical protein
MKYYLSVKKSTSLKISLCALTALATQPVWCMQKDKDENKFSLKKQHIQIAENNITNNDSQSKIRLTIEQLKDEKKKNVSVKFDDNWTEENVKEYYKILKENQVTDFFLTINQDRDLQSLSNILAGTSIKKLRIEPMNAEKNLDKDIMNTFLQRVASHQILTEFYLENIKIEAKSMECFSETLKINMDNNIDRLRFVNCSIGKESAQFCFNIFNHSKNLTCLQLHNNKVGDDAVDDLSQIIQKFPTERKIQITLNANSLTKEGKLKLLNAAEIVNCKNQFVLNKDKDKEPNRHRANRKITLVF